jgi:hypothetical protein
MLCGGTPYGSYKEKFSQSCINDEECYCTVDSASAAEAMLETLVGLLPEKEQWQREIDTVLGYSGEWCYVGKNYGLTNGHNGITTDGRNAFPNAKEVWERVFARQRVGKMGYFGSPWRGGKSWVKDMYFAAWDEASKIQSPCPTCGQEVKQKVTKYKVAYFNDGVVESFAEYTNEEEFKTDNPTLEFIGLIKSTAKEFEV